jgi:hypothetical protein
MTFDPSDLYYYMLDLFVNNYLKTDRSRVLRIFNEGGARCFNGLQTVKTSTGDKPIKDVKPGDSVLTLNEGSGEEEFKPVEEVHRFDNTKRTIRVKMKNGDTIECTEDHEFYYEGGWYSLKHLLSLREKT